LPDGRICQVSAFHISLEGLETCILCRDDDDYDAFVKRICVCSLTRNVIVVTYIVMSNHIHAVILAESIIEAKAFAEELKRECSQYFSSRYSERKVLLNTSTNVQYLDTDWYLRNALAYDARNALDACSSIDTYEWSGHRAMFGNSRKTLESKPVALLSRRQKTFVMHTREDLSSVKWRVDEQNRLIPSTFCCCKYLEDAFLNDQAFYLKTIGTVNMAEMEFKLVDGPKTMLNDTEFLKIAEDVSQRFYSSPIAVLPVPKRMKLVSYISRIQKTSVAQLARTFTMEQTTIRNILNLGPKNERLKAD